MACVSPSLSRIISHSTQEDAKHIADTHRELKLTEILPSYFVEPKSDEIRLIDGPNYYFNYFHSKNMRYNDCQRFAFNTAVVSQLIHPRLEALGLTKLALPLGTSTTEPHVPIFVSPGLQSKKRVVLIVGESEQELGVIAHRVIGGAGGVDKGSMVDIARAILQGDQGGDQNHDEEKKKHAGGGTGSGAADTAPGLVLANTGELWWWPEGGRGLTPRASQGAPMRSAVHWGRFGGGGANAVPRNGTPNAHVRCVFEQVLGGDDPGLVAADAVVQVVGVGDGAAVVQRVLDGSWARWGGRVGCLAMCGGGLDVDSLRDDGLRAFLREVSLCSTASSGTSVCADANVVLLNRSRKHASTPPATSRPALSSPGPTATTGRSSQRTTAPTSSAPASGTTRS